MKQIQAQKINYKTQQNSLSCGFEQSNNNKSCTKITIHFSAALVPMLQFEAVINQPEV